MMKSVQVYVLVAPDVFHRTLANICHLILTTIHEETAPKGLIARPKLSELSRTICRDDCLISFQVIVY